MTVFFLALPFTTYQWLCGGLQTKLWEGRSEVGEVKGEREREEGRREIFWFCCDSAVKFFFLRAPHQDWRKPGKPARRGFCPSKARTAGEMRYQHRTYLFIEV